MLQGFWAPCSLGPLLMPHSPPKHKDILGFRVFFRVFRHDPRNPRPPTCSQAPPMRFKPTGSEDGRSPRGVGAMVPPWQVDSSRPWWPTPPRWACHALHHNMGAGLSGWGNLVVCECLGAPRLSPLSDRIQAPCYQPSRSLPSSRSHWGGNPVMRPQACWGRRVDARNLLVYCKRPTVGSTGPSQPD